MKKSLVAVALLGTFAASAFAAPSVTLYGKIDLGLQYAHTNYDGFKNLDSKDTVSMEAGQRNGNRWGLKGTEDLGAAKVGFLLESGFSGDDGKSAQGGRLFGRAAALNVQTAYGTVWAGRFNSLLSDGGPIEMLSVVSPFGSAWGVLGNHNSDGMDWARYDNSLAYVSPKFAGMKFEAMYSMKADTSKDGTENKADATRYAAAGLQGSWGKLNAMFGGDYTMYGNKDFAGKHDGWNVVLGGNYNFGPVTAFAKANYFKNMIFSDKFGGVDIMKKQDAKGNYTVDIASEGWGLSLAALAPTTVGNFKAEIGYREAKDVKDSAEKYKRGNVTLGYEYNFSKRTTFYATTGYVQTNAKAKNVKPSTYVVGTGLVHSF